MRSRPPHPQLIEGPASLRAQLGSLSPDGVEERPEPDLCIVHELHVLSRGAKVAFAGVNCLTAAWLMAHRSSCERGAGCVRDASSGSTPITSIRCLCAGWSTSLAAFCPAIHTPRSSPCTTTSRGPAGSASPAFTWAQGEPVGPAVPGLGVTCCALSGVRVDAGQVGGVVHRDLPTVSTAVEQVEVAVFATALDGVELPVLRTREDVDPSR